MFMTVVFSLIAVSVSSAAVAAADPKPCCFPHQWRVIRLSIGASVKHGSHKAEIIEVSMIRSFNKNAE